MPYGYVKMEKKRKIQMLIQLILESLTFKLDQCSTKDMFCSGGIFGAPIQHRSLTIALKKGQNLFPVHWYLTIAVGRHFFIRPPCKFSQCTAVIEDRN